MVELVKRQSSLNLISWVWPPPQDTHSRRKLVTFTNCPLTSILVSAHPHSLAHTHTQTYKFKNVIKLVKNLILASFLVVETKYFDKGSLGERRVYSGATVPGYSRNTVPWWGSHHGEAHNRWSHPSTVWKQNQSRELCSLAQLLSLFHSEQIPVCDIVSHIEDRSSNLSYLNLKKKIPLRHSHGAT